VLSRRFHAFLGQKGAYTRKVGLDRETNKALLLKHIRENVKEGSRMEELGQVLPSLTRHQIVRLLRALREAGEIRVEGTTRQARWYPTGGSR
jgi:ATP-dependent DNA helicase RecG